MADSFDAVVVGSGFGGTILALSFANKFQEDNANDNTDKKVCLLERGQWWISHELSYTPKAVRRTLPNMREYLEDNGRPYHFWAHPDMVTGVLELLSSSRTVSKTGLYDYRVLGNVHAIVSSGVGGGSLIYSNVTLTPHASIYRDWPTQKTGKGIEEYFEAARQFLVVNKIPTTAGLSRNLLDKSKAFQDAGHALIDGGSKDIINVKIEGGRIAGDFDLDLSITNVPAGLFQGLQPPSDEELRRLLDRQESICQRQGRCVLGCIPGARHTFGQYLALAMNPRPPAKPKPLEVRELCEVYDIEFQEGEEYKYRIKYFQYDPKTEHRQPKEILARALIIAAGSLGSTELLLKCRDRGHLQTSDILGKKFFTNGDILGFMTLEHRKIDVTRGPINTSYVSFRTSDKEYAYTIEDTTISKMVAPIFATLFDLYSHGAREADLSLLENLVQNLNLLLRFGIFGLFAEGITNANLLRLFTIMWNDPSVRKVLVDILKTGTSSDEPMRRFMESVLAWASSDHTDPNASPEERISRFYAFSGMGRGERPGALRLKPYWRDMERSDDPGDMMAVDWPAADNNQTLKDTVNGMKRLAGEMDAGGSKRVYTPTWNFEKPEKSTALILHPLGGCSMGEDVERGVVDSYGQVFWNDGSGNKTKVYPDLYVIDGSVMPEPTGVNPTLTIAAIAFRAAEKIVGERYLPLD